ncbi:MAG: lytic murein transglycosylase [Alphaproteobacteria bacterium]|nr:lytic murein transglycosylase [Alphaproteobacteria bacterium]MBV9966005.1 lytic murein transglycosylase [Alphaproteobacteria bacterium]
MLAAAPLLALPLGGGMAMAAESDFNSFLAGLRRDALAQGVRPGTVDLAFRYIQYLPHVIELDQHQPDHVLTFAEFIGKVVNPQRIEDARGHLAENWTLLQRVQQRFGVQPRFIVALWGVESDFGKTQGSYSVPAALATLAYEGRRGPMFRGELITALRILDQGHIRPENMLGSWAGAMGQCQFMPSTFLSYAVDFDGDGRRDIWNDRADVLGSIANYLARLGWRGNESWGREVAVPANFDTRYTGLENRRPIADWMRLGVRSLGAPLTGREAAEASLVLPDGLGGRALLVFDNFRATMRWNKSVKFAAAVGMIADGMDRG